MDTTEFKKLIQESMVRHFLNSKGVESVDDANSVDRGKAFLHFYLIDIFKDLYAISPEAIEEGIVDRAGDGGIDFIHIDSNKVYII